MEDSTFGFIVILLGAFAAAMVVTFIAHLLKIRKMSRLKNPRRDYYR